MRNRLIDLVIQVIPVMIGVFLAFLVSDCSEERRTERKTEQMKDILVAEIKKNREKIQQVAEYHKMLRDSTGYYCLQSDTSGAKPKFFKGIRNVSLSSGAYESAIQTGLISELELEHIQFVNELYEAQENYNDYNQMLLEGLINQDFSNPEQMQSVMRFISVGMYDVVIKEANLIDAYPKVLKMLEAK